MKQLINKLFILSLFVVCMIIIPTNKVSADTVWISNGNGGNSFYATFELSFQSEGYSGLDPVGIDKYVMASGSFECIDNCWGTYLLARVENLTGDVLILAGDSAAFYGGGTLLNYYPSGGTFYSSTPVFYNLGWNTVTFTGQTELAQFTYQIPFFYDPLPPAVSVAVSPSSIVQGTSNDVTVSWTAPGADNCLEDGGRGGTGATGSFIDYGVSDVVTYSVFCYDMYGTVVAYGDASVYAEVLPPPPPLPPVLSVQVMANNSNPLTVPYNNNGVDVTWKTTGNPTSCICTYGSTGCGEGFSGQIPKQGTNLPSKLTANTTFNVICTDQVISSVPPPADPVYTSTGYVCPSYYPSCFIADTVVQMADGTTKNIQDVKIGDLLKGEKTNNKVLGFHDPKLNDKKLYSFNGGRYFVTAEHPFKTIDGWKSINPALTASENIGITVTELKVGDTLITESGKVLLKTINSKSGEANTQLYNFILDGDHTYYADEYLVHNKMACRDGQVPNLAGGCEGPCAFSCPSGYTKSCNGGSTLCTQDYCGSWVTSYNCTGTVVGSSPQTYEGQSCNQFGTEATCLQGRPTHGCSWNGTTIPDGVCSNAAGSVICTKQKTAATCSAISSCQWVYTNAN